MHPISIKQTMLALALAWASVPSTRSSSLAESIAQSMNENFAKSVAIFTKAIHIFG